MYHVSYTNKNCVTKNLNLLLFITVKDSNRKNINLRTKIDKWWNVKNKMYFSLFL